MLGWGTCWWLAPRWPEMENAAGGRGCNITLCVGMKAPQRQRLPGGLFRRVASIMLSYMPLSYLQLIWLRCLRVEDIGFYVESFLSSSSSFENILRNRLITGSQMKSSVARVNMKQTSKVCSKVNFRDAESWISPPGCFPLFPAFMLS